MSRHVIPIPDGEIVVGYDGACAHYFLQIFNNQGKLDVEHNATSVESLVTHCKPYHDIPSKVLASIINERVDYEYIAGFSSTLGKSADSRRDLNSAVKRKFHLVEIESASAYFDDMKRRFLECTSAYDLALCATYSLSDRDIIRALGSMKYISVLTDQRQYQEHLGRGVDYSRLMNHDGVPSQNTDCIETFNDGEDSSHTRYDQLDPFRVVDLAANGQYESFHTKFCVFCNVIEHRDEEIGYTERVIIPKAVWVGSYNPTPTGERSIQASILLRDRKMVLAFMSEYYAIYRVSKRTKPRIIK